MTNYIGPIEITIPHIQDGNLSKLDGTEQINIICPQEQAKQILGLCETNTKNQYGNVRVINSRESRWGVIPVDTSEHLKINQNITHKGIYLLSGEPEETELNPNTIRLDIPAERISKNFYEVLSVLYSEGGEDGAEIELSDELKDTVETVILNEDFGGVYTNNWESVTSYAMDNVSVSTSGNKLYLTGRNTNTGVLAPWGGLHLESKYTFEPPFTLEFDLEWVTGSDHNMSIYMFESKPHIWGDLTTHASNTNYFRIYLYHYGGKLHYGILKCVSGVISYMVPETELSTTTETRPRFKIKYYLGGDIEIYIDKTGGTNYTLIWGRANLGHNWTNPGFAYHMDNMSGSIVTMHSSIFKVSVEGSANHPNTVVIPPGAVCNVSPDFYRSSEYGNIGCIKDPQGPINYQISPEDWFKGMVKGINSNYDDSTPRLVTFNEMELALDKFYISNGIVKLAPKTNGVELSYWTGSSYTLMETFTLPSTPLLIKPVMVTKDLFTLQLDRTFWTVRAGKPSLWIEHEFTQIGYTLKSCYYHDGVILTNPAVDTSISMENQFYCNLWNRGTGTCENPNPVQRYRLSIIQVEPTTIKSNSIPESGMTGIVVYDTNISDNQNDGLFYRIREWFKPTMQSLAIQGV